MVYSEKVKEVTNEHVLQVFKDKEGNEISKLGFLGNASIFEDFENYIKSSYFFKELRDWEDQLNRFVSIEIKDKKIRIHADPKVFKVMWKNLSKGSKEELSLIGVENEKNFELFMLQIMVRRLIIPERTKVLIENDLKK